MTAPPIVLLGREGLSTRVLHNALRQRLGPLPLILETPPSRASVFKRRAKRYGLSIAIGQVLFKLLEVPRLEATGRDRRVEILAESDLDASPLPDYAVHVASANSVHCVSLLRSAQPRLVVISGTRILSKEVLRSTPGFFVNGHAGITPLYRGVHGGYWALAQNDPKHCGVTVHRVDEGIDTGAILAQALISPAKADNFATYPLLQLAAGLGALVEVVRNTQQGIETARLDPPSGPSACWTHPTLWQYHRAGIP